MVFNAFTFYGTSYYLIPTYLYKRKLGKFLSLTALFFLITSFGLGFTLLWTMAPYIPTEYKNASWTIFLGAFSTNIFFPGSMCAAKLVIDRVKADRERKQMENQRLGAELQYLKAQVNPHFLFNAINSIYFLIKKDPETAAATLIRLSDLLRFQLYDCSDEKIPIEKELEYLQNYISLETIRKGNKVKIEFDMRGNLTGFRIAPFLLMPFLENAFKFVSNFTDKPNVICVKLDRENGRITGHFSNTFDGVQRYTVGGVGLKNVKRRLELLYPDEHELQFDEKPGQYSVTISLPVHGS
jgi:LytS/YehU family sensor histidine kinase